MSKGQKLIQKVTRLQRAVRKLAPGYEEVNKAEEVLQDSPGAYDLMRVVQQRYDDAFGWDAVAHKPQIHYAVVATTLERFDYGGGDFGMRLTLPAGIMTDAGIRVGDVVEILEQSLEGRSLEVVELTSSTQMRLDDVSTFGGAESDVAVRMIISSQKAATS